MAPLRSTPGRFIAGVCAVMVLSLASSLAARDALGDTSRNGIPPRRIERDVRRFRIVATDNVMELLAIHPGMTVLDIGAGTGQFAYEFARRLDGIGTVYATDSQARCVEYMRREAGRRGLANLRPVLVSKEGIDAFYAQSRYDLNTVFHVAMNYEEKIDYFRALRRLLAKGGRLVLIVYKIPTPFSRDDFAGDLRGLIGDLSAEPEASPFHGILTEATRRRIRQGADDGPAGETATAVVDGFNRLLRDPAFAALVLKQSGAARLVRFLAGERPYAEWLLRPFRQNDVRNGTVDARGGAGDATVATVNKLLLVQRYRDYLKPEGMFLSGFTPAVRAAFGEAGYRVAGQYPDLVPFEDVIVLVPRSSRAATAPSAP